MIPHFWVHVNLFLAKKYACNLSPSKRYENRKRCRFTQFVNMYSLPQILHIQKGNFIKMFLIHLTSTKLLPVSSKNLCPSLELFSFCTQRSRERFRSFIRSYEKELLKVCSYFGPNLLFLLTVSEVYTLPRRLTHVIQSSNLRRGCNSRKL